MRRAIVSVGLLERDYRYYGLRGGSAFLMLLAAFAIALGAPATLGWALLSAVLIAFASVQVGFVGHDAGHQAVFSGRRANWALGSVCWSLCLGIGFWYWRDRHNRHHASTNDLTADPEIAWAGLVRRQAMVGACLAVVLAFAFRLESWAFAARYLRGRRRVIEICLLVVSMALWTSPALRIGLRWAGIFVLTQVLAGLYLALANAPNHKGMPTWPKRTAPPFFQRQVVGSRNVDPHPLTDFLMGGLNYQIEHHLFPTLPRSAFGAARAIVKPFCASHGVPYTEMSFVASFQLVLVDLRKAQLTAAAHTYVD